MSFDLTRCAKCGEDTRSVEKSAELKLPFLKQGTLTLHAHITGDFFNSVGSRRYCPECSLVLMDMMMETFGFEFPKKVPLPKAEISNAQFIGSVLHEAYAAMPEDTYPAMPEDILDRPGPGYRLEDIGVDCDCPGSANPNHSWHLIGCRYHVKSGDL